jgi:hypothetical protein
LGTHTWLGEQACPVLGLDFMHDCAGGRTLVAGRNPYQSMEGHFFFDRFTYPPLVLPLYAWCSLLPPEGPVAISTGVEVLVRPYPGRAIKLWSLLSAAVFAWAVFVAWRARPALARYPVALPLATGLTLLSFPVVFALERGSGDWLMLIPIVLAGLLLQRPDGPRTWLRELGAGALIGVASWMKLYPALLILALLALRRWRAAAAALATMVVIGLVSLPWLGQWLAAVAGHLDVLYVEVHPHAHSVSGNWRLLCAALGLTGLGQLPRLAGGMVVLGPVAAAMAWLVLRSRKAPAHSLAVVLWMSALATFFPLISNDYNLFFLPLAAIMVWDRDDPWWVHLCTACLLPALQPWALFANAGPALLLLKLVGLLGVGASLAIKLHAAQPEPAAASA